MQTTLTGSENSANDEIWRQLAPHLDEAISKLRATDRDALILRYFENKNLHEIGAALGVEERAAQKRVNRAVEKLRRYFSKRGLGLTSAIIVGAVSANSVHAAPTGLAATISAIAVSKGTGATISVLTLVKETMKFMKWSNMKIAIVIGVAAILAAGTTTLIAEHDENSNKSDDKLYYNMLDDAYQLASSVDKSKFVINISIRPISKSVPISNVHLTVKSPTEGIIPIEVSTNGEILNVPHDEILRRENPPIDHQPTNRLNLTIRCYIPSPENLVFRYDLFSDGAAEADKFLVKANAIIKASYVDQMPANMRRMAEKLAERKIQSVILCFPNSSAGKANLKIISIDGTKKYTADSKSQIKLELDQKLITENPEVELSEKPSVIAPDFWEIN